MRPSRRDWLFEIVGSLCFALACGALLAGLVFGLADYAAGREIYMYSTPGCPACEQMRPLVAELRAKGWPISEAKITPANAAEARSLGIDRVPCWILWEGSRELARCYGPLNWQGVKALLDYGATPKTEPTCAAPNTGYTPKPRLDPDWRPAAPKQSAPPQSTYAEPPRPSKPPEPKRPLGSGERRAESEEPKPQCDGATCPLPPVSPTADGRQPTVDSHPVADAAGKWILRRVVETGLSAIGLAPEVVPGLGLAVANLGLPGIGLATLLLLGRKWLRAKREKNEPRSSTGGSGVPPASGFRRWY